MGRTVSIACLVFLALLPTYAQEVYVPRDTSAPLPVVRAEKTTPVKEPAKEQIEKAEPEKALVAKAQPVKPPVKEPATALTAKPPVAKAEPAIAETAKTQPLKVALVKMQPVPPAVSEAPSTPSSPPVSGSVETGSIKLADGFDFPIGKPDAKNYYKARGFRTQGHLGEDWDGTGGGDTDLRDPVYSIADGIVVFARDCRMGWGNVVIVRHAYRERGETKTIDALYGHLHNILVRKGQMIARGQQVGTIGTAHGLYDAHLHLEIRKNLEIGMSRAKFARDFSNYYDPTQFIQAHRQLPNGGEKYRVALNTFKYDSKINWAMAKNYSSYRGGGSESAAALKKALASQKR